MEYGSLVEKLGALGLMAKMHSGQKITDKTFCDRSCKHYLAFSPGKVVLNEGLFFTPCLLQLLLLPI